MFNFFKKSSPTLHPLSVLHTDMHSHLIPGIDDGAKTMEDSLELIKALQGLGYKKIITTPHIYFELYPNSKAIITGGLTKLQKALKQAEIDITLEAAAEYFMDDHFEELLQKNELLSFASNHVLVETSFFAAPPKLENYIFQLRTKGYQPILAHPERYSFMAQNFKKYERLKDMGCLFQLNLLSIAGRYGPQIQKTAEKMLKLNMIEFLGTDLHNQDHLYGIEQMVKSNKVTKLLKKYTFKNASL